MVKFGGLEEEHCAPQPTLVHSTSNGSFPPISAIDINLSSGYFVRSAGRAHDPAEFCKPQQTLDGLIA